jgi:hypothetical protein
MIWQAIDVGIKIVQPLLLPICFGCAWLLVAAIVSNVTSTVSSTIATAKTMHQIPCTNCQFFTNDYRLKCTVHPQIANSEQAIDCRDYREIRD